MAHKETHTERTERSSLPNLIPTEFAAMGKKRFDELVAMQTERMEKLQEASRRWFDRMQAEVSLASELATKLTAARFFPIAANSVGIKMGSEDLSVRSV